MKKLAMVITEEMDEKIDEDVKNARKFKYIQSKSSLAYAYLMAGIEVYEAAQNNNKLAVEIWMRAESKIMGTNRDAALRRGQNSAATRMEEAAKLLRVEEERQEAARAMPEPKTVGDGKPTPTKRARQAKPSSIPEEKPIEKA